MHCGPAGKTGGTQNSFWGQDRHDRHSDRQAEGWKRTLEGASPGLPGDNLELGLPPYAPLPHLRVAECQVGKEHRASGGGQAGTGASGR